MVYADKSQYTGQWRDGRRHGKGIMAHADESRHEGEWRNDKFQGNKAGLDAKRFSNIGLSAWGGIPVAGGELHNYQIGCKGNFNIPISQFDLGLGSFFHYSALDDVTRKAAGLELALTWRTSFISPYLRATYSLYGSIKGDDFFWAKAKGNGLGIGLGVQYAVSESIKLFAECMYDFRGYELRDYSILTLQPEFQFATNYVASINFGLTYSINFKGSK